MPANHTVTVQKTTIGYENTQIPPADLIQWIKNNAAQLRGIPSALQEQHRRLSTGSIYGLPPMNLQYFAIEHIFIMVPPVDGWYTVTLTKSDDASYLAIRSPAPRSDSSENGQPYRMPQTWGDMVRDDLQRNAFQQKYIRRLLKGSDTGPKGMRFFAQAGHPVMFNYKSANVMGGPFAARIEIRDSKNRLILGDREPEISNCIFTEPCMDIPLGHLQVDLNKVQPVDNTQIYS